MRRSFISTLGVVLVTAATALATGAFIGTTWAQDQRPRPTTHEDGPETWVILKIAGEPGDDTYASYQSRFGINHGCHHMGVTDDVNSPWGPYIHSTELCELTTADAESAPEILSSSLLAIFEANVQNIPIMINQEGIIGH